MRVSIGILAWNEASSIETTVASICDQAIDADNACAVEILCVPNGCTDDTADVARRALDRKLPSVWSGRVCELEKPSKVEAWNAFVHEFSDPQADVLILVDGDVKILGSDALNAMLQALRDRPHAHVAGARTVKHISLRPGWNPMRWVSLAVSRIRRQIPGTFAGCLYAIRAGVARRGRLPSVLIAEEEYLHSMVLTDYMTKPHDRGRVVQVDGAEVLFEAYTRATVVFRNLRRRAFTHAINKIVYEAVEQEVKASGRHAGEVVEAWRAEDSSWDRRLVMRAAATIRRRVHPFYNYQKWLLRLRHQRWYLIVALVPVALLAATLDTIAGALARRDLRQGRLEGHWFETRTQFDSAESATSEGRGA